MADNVTTQGNGSPERVAYDLLKLIAAGEAKNLGSPGAATKEWILNTYVECLYATTNRRELKTDFR